MRFRLNNATTGGPECRVILLAQQRMSNHSIAKQLGLSRPTVIAAPATFGVGGVQALTAKPTRNRPRRFRPAFNYPQVRCG